MILSPQWTANVLCGAGVTRPSVVLLPSSSTLLRRSLLPSFASHCLFSNTGLGSRSRLSFWQLISSWASLFPPQKNTASHHGGSFQRQEEEGLCQGTRPRRTCQRSLATPGRQSRARGANQAGSLASRPYPRPWRQGSHAFLLPRAHILGEIQDEGPKKGPILALSLRSKIQARGRGAPYCLPASSKAGLALPACRVKYLSVGQ